MTDLCFSSGLLPIKQALMRILAEVQSIEGVEKKSLKNALGRVLAQSIYSPIAIPPDRNSAMDGYAFASSDSVINEKFTLKHVGTSWAGKPFKGKLLKGQCVRIFTGAVMPEQADTVMIQERVEVATDNNIIFPENCIAFDNVRQAGGDVEKFSCLLASGKKLTAVDLGLLAAAGVHSVDIKRKLRIAYFSTGDELISIEQVLTTGKIYDSNRYLLFGLLNNPCIEAVDMGVIKDDKTLLEQAFLSAANHYDVIITTGGASVGDADYINEILAKLGQVNFWKVAMKPGKPVAFGRIKACVFFGLPGNPASVVATFDTLVTPALQKMVGFEGYSAIGFHATCKQILKKPAGRQEYQRGILTQHDDGFYSVVSAGGQNSNQLKSFSHANCYIILASEVTDVQIGEKIWVEPFERFI
ncbi:MAG: molybdopterin molybdotransferase MoeA [Methylococcales bacterium]|nr:molybdopterin molybdotransferase MoeA [Methylococcales bacterium]